MDVVDLPTLPVLAGRLRDWQVAAMNVDIVWVFGPKDPLPGKWDCAISVPFGKKGNKPTAWNGRGKTPNEALQDAMNLLFESMETGQ